MELVSNLLQFIVTLLGFSLSGIRYLKSRKQAYFLLTCFMAALPSALCTGRCICFYILKHRRSFMCRSLAG